jgi:hypothetical protein
MLMPHRNVARRIVTVLGAGALAACSDRSPVSPAAGGDPVAVLSRASQSAAGSYELSFFKSSSSGLEPVASLPVLGAELILGAHIQDQVGVPAQRGTVTFQYCSLKRLPPGDINRADEAPSAKCADGSASWANLGSVSVDASGNAYLVFGIVRIPRVVGFRCKYSPQGGSIASGVCTPKDFLWTG